MFTNSISQYLFYVTRKQNLTLFSFCVWSAYPFDSTHNSRSQFIVGHLKFKKIWFLKLLLQTSGFCLEDRFIIISPLVYSGLLVRRHWWQKTPICKNSCDKRENDFMYTDRTKPRSNIGDSIFYKQCCSPNFSLLRKNK